MRQGGEKLQCTQLKTLLYISKSSFRQYGSDQCGCAWRMDSRVRDGRRTSVSLQCLLIYSLKLYLHT